MGFWGGIRYLVFREATNEQIGMTYRICARGCFIAILCLAVGNATGSPTMPQFFAPAAETKAALTMIAQELAALRMERKQDRLEDLDVQIFRMRRDYCEEQNPKAKKQIAERVGELVRQYERDAGRLPRIPSCDET